MLKMGWSHLGRSAVIGFIAGVALLMQGCATSQNTLTLASVDQKKDFSQAFDKAYASINENGDYDLVLVNDSISQLSSNTPDGAMQPEAMTPRQLVHIRVFWKARSGTKADHAASTNASVRWFLFGDRPDEMANLLEYSGCGLVMLYDGGSTATFTVRGAFLQPVICRGSMSDPIGPGTITGTVTATMDSQRVKDLLAQINSVEGAAQAAATPANPTVIP